ncbi:MAG: hypothetical protein WDN25_13185 [Acetobacteraceae bacterium]
MSTDTGETTAVIYARRDREAWDNLLPRLRAGVIINRPSSKLRTYYVDGDGGFQPSFIKQLEREGVIRRVGVEAYQLTEFLDAKAEVTS